MKHPIYSFLDINERGQVHLLPNNPVDDPEKKRSLNIYINTWEKPYVKHNGYQWYLSDLVADTYLKPPEGYSRHMVRPVWKDGTPMSDWRPENIEWEYLAKVDSFGEVVWNPIPIYLVDITKILTDKAVFEFESKAELKRFIRSNGGSEFNFAYGPDSYFKLMHGRYITLRKSFDDPPNYTEIQSKHWYLLKRNNGRFEYHRSIRQQDMMDPNRHPEGFDRDHMKAVFMHHNVANERSIITSINEEYAICRAEDYVTHYGAEYDKVCEETKGDIPF